LTVRISQAIIACGIFLLKMRIMNKIMTTVFQLLFIALTLGSCGKETPEKWDTKHAQQNEAEQYGEPFDKVPEIADITMYEVNLRAFSQSGDLNGVKEGLDHIKDLGINVIWLMPIHPTATEKSVGSPYAVKDYMSIHADYGNLEDLRLLVEEAHRRDMAVILDWVANHTAWDHQWLNNDGWYVKDDNGNIIHPPGTNWQDVAELNYNNQAMRREMIKSLKYWALEANIDGFRCDYAGGAPDDFWQEAIDELRAIPNRDIIMFAESERKELSNAGFDMVFGWPFYSSLKEVYANASSTGKLFTDHASEYKGLATGSQVVRWITNHDQNAWDDVPQHFFGDSNDGAMSAFVLATYMGGVPLVYTGQEVAHPQKLGFFEGMTEKIDWSINPEVLAEYKQVLNHYNQSVVAKVAEMNNFSSDEVVAFKKSMDNQEVLVVVNVNNREVLYSIPQELEDSAWINVKAGNNVKLSASIQLAPYEYLLLEK